MFSFLFRSYY